MESKMDSNTLHQHKSKDQPSNDYWKDLNLSMLANDHVCSMLENGIHYMNKKPSEKMRLLLIAIENELTRRGIRHMQFGGNTEVNQTQADIEDYAARCANKAYEEAIHRATHGLVTLQEIQDAA